MRSVHNVEKATSLLDHKFTSNYVQHFRAQQPIRLLL